MLEWTTKRQKEILGGRRSISKKGSTQRFGSTPTVADASNATSGGFVQHARECERLFSSSADRLFAVAGVIPSARQRRRDDSEFRWRPRLVAVSVTAAAIHWCASAAVASAAVLHEREWCGEWISNVLFWSAESFRLGRDSTERGEIIGRRRDKSILEFARCHVGVSVSEQFLGDSGRGGGAVSGGRFDGFERRDDRVITATSAMHFMRKAMRQQRLAPGTFIESFAAEAVRLRTLRRRIHDRASFAIPSTVQATEGKPVFD